MKNPRNWHAVNAMQRTSAGPVKKKTKKENISVEKEIKDGLEECDEKKIYYEVLEK